MRVFQWLKDKLYNSQYDVPHRIFNLFLSSGVVLMLVCTFLALFWGGTLKVTNALGIAAAMVLILWIANYFHIVHICAIITSLTLNCAVLPYLFFQTGGIAGCISLWFVFGILHVLLLCEGRGFKATLVLSVIGIAGSYVLAWCRPELVNTNHTPFEIYKDTVISVVIIALSVSGIRYIQIQNSINARRRMEQKQKELEEYDRSREQFFATMSHELRTPINAIVGLNEMTLREKNISGEIEENSLYIRSAGQTLLALINDILDYSKIQSGKMEIVEGQYELLPLINELYVTFKTKANDKKLKFILDISPEIPSVLWGDAVRIKQILNNFLSNAVKYTEEGKITLQMKCQKADERSVCLKFSVIDTGIGIKRDDISRVFEEYRRVDKKRNNSIEGTGLGLTICKKLSDMMGGEILVDSVYHKGSTFTFSIRQDVVDKTPIGQINDMLHTQIGEKYVYEQKFEAPDARILVVDDNEMNRLVVQKLLRNSRVRLDMAESGEKCLEMTSRKQYHIILLDHIMPGMDGIETLERIRTQENGLCRQSPVIALTANAAVGIEKEYIARGFDAYLVKPVSGLALESMVLKFLPESLVKKYSNEEEASEIGAADSYTVVAADTKHKDNLRITVESSCDLSRELMKEKGIDWISCYVKTEDGRFCDGKEITHGAVLDYLRKGKRVQMEVPSVEEYETFFADELDGAYQVIHICSSSKIDVGYQNAFKAAKAFGNVYVFDSRQVSGGTALLALYATDMVKKGMQFSEIVKELEKLKQRVTASFVIGDSKAFFYNQKASNAVNTFCNLFSLTPAVRVRDGALRVIAFYAGDSRRVFRKFIKRQLKRPVPEHADRLVMVYTGCPSENRNIILEGIKKKIHFDEIIVLPASAAGSGISGLKSCGIYYINEK